MKRKLVETGTRDTNGEDSTPQQKRLKRKQEHFEDVSFKTQENTNHDVNDDGDKLDDSDIQMDDASKHGFSDPTDKSKDNGLGMPRSLPWVKFERYQRQIVEEIEVSGCIHKVCYPPLPKETVHQNKSEDQKDEKDESKMQSDSISLLSEMESEISDSMSTMERSFLESIRFMKSKIPSFKMAKEYPYELDIFQKESVLAIEMGHNVLVSAHTSAGKTTVAEYAIAKSLSQKQRVIYTSPIKALSNQKFRALKEEFLDVGLMTGDVTINREAGVLVMTTEILRNMLYRGAAIVREIAWVVFDEIHYMRDPHRGVVWEETLILLPKQARLVFLSATIPNSIEFGKWISKLNGNPCHVIYTEYRPVPLQHYVFPSGGKGIHLVVDHTGQFRELNFQKALNSMKIASASRSSDGSMSFSLSKQDGSSSSSSKKRRIQQLGQQKSEDLFKLCKMVVERELDPCIVFAFSRKDVEKLAFSLKKMNLTSEDEKREIVRVYKNALATLSEEDRQLKQLKNLIHLLRNGIGIHHAGLLPIAKEIVEILFGENLIKILFATETFAMGVNFPAKCVIFSDVSKWDGEKRRLLTGGEYTQMSGRSGRRGLDTRGVVIMLLNDRLEPAQVQTMLQGKADRLISQFHLKYSMIIQLLRVSGADETEEEGGGQGSQKKKEEEDSEQKQREGESIVKTAPVSNAGAHKMDATFLIVRSFMHFQRLEKTPELVHGMKKAEKRISELKHSLLSLWKNDDDECESDETEEEEKPITLKDDDTVMSEIVEYTDLIQKMSEAECEVRCLRNHPKYLNPWLNPGRLVEVCDHSRNRHWGWGVIITHRKLSDAEKQARKEERQRSLVNCRDKGVRWNESVARMEREFEDNTGAGRFICDVLLPCFKDKKTPSKLCSIFDKLPGIRDNAEMSDRFLKQPMRVIREMLKGSEDEMKLLTFRVIPVRMAELGRISKVRMNLSRSLHTSMNRRKMGQKMWECLSQCGGKFGKMPLLDDPLDKLEKCPQMERLRQVKEEVDLKSKDCAHRMSADLWTDLEEWRRWKDKKQSLEQELIALESNEHISGQLRGMQRVLRTLGMTTESSTVTLKGSVACELSSADELLCTELLFSNFFLESGQMSAARVAAVLSCLVFDEPAKSTVQGSDDDYRRLRNTAACLGKVCRDSSLRIHLRNYVESFSPGMMEVCHSWSQGSSFKEISQLTENYEGSIVRVIRRLDELLDQMILAATMIGNGKLIALFQSAKQTILRDVVFTPSLYL